MASASIGAAHTTGASSLVSISLKSIFCMSMETYLLARPPRQTPLHSHHSAGDLIANTRLAAMMVYGRSCSSRASVSVSATRGRGGASGTAVAVLSYLSLVGFVSGVGALEAGHEGWFGGAGCAGAATEHFESCYEYSMMD